MSKAKEFLNLFESEVSSLQNIVKELRKDQADFDKSTAKYSDLYDKEVIDLHYKKFLAAYDKKVISWAKHYIKKCSNPEGECLDPNFLTALQDFLRYTKDSASKKAAADLNKLDKVYKDLLSKAKKG